MIDRRIGANHNDDVGVERRRKWRRHRARGQAFEQSRDRGGVAQPRAVIDIVRAEAGAHQLLEKISLFVGALGRAETGERLDAFFIPYLDETLSRDVERLLPRGLAEMRERI